MASSELLIVIICQKKTRGWMINREAGFSWRNFLAEITRSDGFAMQRFDRPFLCVSAPLLRPMQGSRGYGETGVDVATARARIPLLNLVGGDPLAIERHFQSMTGAIHPYRPI